MEKDRLVEIAELFQEAIIRLKEEKAFDPRDRMSKFPVGCCDDACDLLGCYLYEYCKIQSVQQVAFYEQENCYHTWLKLEDDTIIDITGHQFNGWDAVYVGKLSGCYLQLEITKEQENFDFKKKKEHALYNDYRLILEKLNSKQ